MCALFAIVQYEVHYFQDKRWIVQSRYPGDQRFQAIQEASAVEDTTRLPTKVIKETYYPDENTSDTVTVYIGPLLKAALEKSKKSPSPSLYHSARERVRATKNKLVPRTVAPQPNNFFWRTMITIGMSLGAASVVTFMVSWIMSHLPDFGMALDPAVSSRILMLTYMGFFVLGIFSLFRFGTPIKRLIENFWQSATLEAAHRASRVKFPARKRKIDNAYHIPFERRMEIAEFKRIGGDVDPLPGQPPQPLEDLAFGGDVTPEAAAMPERMTESERQMHMTKIEQMEAEQPGLAQPMPPVVSADTVPPTLEQAGIIENAGRPYQDAASAPQPALPPQATFSSEINQLQRDQALRFVAEVIAPQLAQEPDDAITRRGSALFLTGAMTHLGNVSKLSTALATSLIAGSMSVALPRHAVDAFMGHLETHIIDKANALILNEGKKAMELFLAGQKQDGALVQSLKMWRVPNTHTATSVPTSTSPTDYYLLSVFNCRSTATMDFHNFIIRQSIEASDGQEVKHTGRGILARFDNADLAIKSALATAAQLGSAPEVPPSVFFAIAVMSGFGSADDPLLSSVVTKTAQAELDAAPRGAVICQSTVLARAPTAGVLNAPIFNGSWHILSEVTDAPLAAAPA